MPDESTPKQQPDVGASTAVGSAVALAPVEFIETDDPRKPPQKGIALCLSGGGYRAMLFHLGALIRLNELGQLPRIDKISSVSGGSITAGVLGLKWNKLDFQNGVAAKFQSEVIEPIRKLAAETIDVSSVF